MNLIKSIGDNAFRPPFAQQRFLNFIAGPLAVISHRPSSMNTKLNKFILLTIICILVIACTSKKRTILENGIKGCIIIVFDSTPPPYHSNINGRSIATSIEYINDNFIKQSFLPDPTKNFDTLVIFTKRKYLEISHSYKTLDKLSYIFHNGDVVVFHYQNNTPIAIVKNRKTKPYDINFDLFKKESITPNDYPAFVKFSLPMFFTNNSSDFVRATKKAYDQAIERFPYEINQEKLLLDSLQKNDLISKEISIYFKTLSLYEEKVMQLQEAVGFYSIKPLYQNFRSSDFNTHFEYDKEVGYLNVENILDEKNDSLLYFSFYYDVINWFNWNYLSRKVGRIISTNSIDKNVTAGSNLPDFLILADTIAKNKLLSDRAKNILLFENIQNIIENCSVDQSSKAFKKFSTEVKDTSFVNYVRKKYLLNDERCTQSNDIQLISTDVKRVNFNELIASHKGYVLYIDFWSSNCSPCINQLKYFSGLKELYRSRKVIQVYISIESDKNRWLNACKKYNLGDESYFVENRFTSKQLEDMNIKYIPHYLLFDGKGKLAYEFAPKPNDKKLIYLLNILLSDN